MSRGIVGIHLEVAAIKEQREIGVMHDKITVVNITHSVPFVLSLDHKENYYIMLSVPFHQCVHCVSLDFSLP